MQTEQKLGKKCRELEILDMDVGTAAAQPWAGPGEQTTGNKALVSSWTHSSPPAPSRLLLSLSYTMIQGRTLHPFIPMDQPRAGGKDTVSASGLHIPNHCSDTECQTVFFEVFVLLHCKNIQGYLISLDLQNLPRMLRLLFVQTESGGTTGQEGAVAQGSLAGVTGAAPCDTAFCTSDVFHGSDCAGD